MKIFRKENERATIEITFNDNEVPTAADLVFDGCTYHFELMEELQFNENPNRYIVGDSAEVLDGAHTLVYLPPDDLNNSVAQNIWVELGNLMNELGANTTWSQPPAFYFGITINHNDTLSEILGQLLDVDAASADVWLD